MYCFGTINLVACVRLLEKAKLGFTNFYVVNFSIINR